MHLDGIHHVAAITARPEDCDDFYGLLLGLDRVDRPAAAEGTIAFGDERGTLGSVIGFVPVPGAPVGAAGRGLVHRICWRIGGWKALEYWQRRLELAGVAVESLYDGDSVGLRFADPEGLGHELLLDGSTDAPLLASRTSIPRQFRIRGLGGVRAHVASSLESSDLLAGRLGFEAVDRGDWLVRGSLRGALYGRDEPPASQPMQGAGSVHHVAWSCRRGDERSWRQRVIGMGATVSPILEGERFRSFYFREPDGVLFSVATRDAGPTGAGSGFDLIVPATLSPRITRPIGLLTAL